MSSTNKTISLLAVLFFALAPLAACKKSEKPATPLDGETVGKKMSINLCEKFMACAPDPEFKKEKCLEEVSLGITQKVQGKSILQDQLDGCLKVIQDGNCELLKTETPPVGCEFLQ